MLVEKKDDIDRSTLYSFDGPFQLLKADTGNLEFLGKSATDPKYCLLFGQKTRLKTDQEFSKGKYLI